MRIMNQQWLTIRKSRKKSWMLSQRFRMYAIRIYFLSCVSSPESGISFTATTFAVVLVVFAWHKHGVPYDTLLDT